MLVSETAWEFNRTCERERYCEFTWIKYGYDAMLVQLWTCIINTQMRKTGINKFQNFTEFYLILLNFTHFMDLETVLLWTTKQLTRDLADKCNKDQLKKYPPEDSLM
jgi:hypothetical protein